MSEPLPSRSGAILALCLPMYQSITAETYECVSKFKDSAPPPGWKGMHEAPCRAQPVYLTREAIAEIVLAAPIRTDILLWVDSDCGVDPPERLWDLADRLLKAPPKVGILAAPCRLRGPGAPAMNIGHYRVSQVAPGGAASPDMPLDAWYSPTGDGKDALPTHPDRATSSHPFVLVPRAGFGVVAIRREVFEAIPRPWFEMPWAKDPKPGASAYERMGAGEDTGFCTKAREAGFWTVADTSITGWHLIEDRAEIPAHQRKPFDPAASWRRP